MSIHFPVRVAIFLLGLTGGPAAPFTLFPVDHDTTLVAMAASPDAQNIAIRCEELRGPMSRCFAGFAEGDGAAATHPAFDGPLPATQADQARIFSVRGDAAWLSESLVLAAIGRYVRDPKSQEIVAHFLLRDGSPSAPPIIIATGVLGVLDTDVRIVGDDEKTGAWIYWTSEANLHRRHIRSDGTLGESTELVSDAVLIGPRIAGDALLYVERANGNEAVVMRSGAGATDLGASAVIDTSATPYGKLDAARTDDGATIVMWTLRQRGCALEGVTIRGEERSRHRLPVCPAAWALAPGGHTPFVTFTRSNGLVVGRAINAEVPSPVIIGDGYDPGDGLPVLRIDPDPSGALLVTWRQPSRIASRLIGTR